MVWQDGQSLQNGKYLILGEPLGRGGFGITYKAQHVRLQEEVVIKTPDKYLKTDPEYSKYIERFVKEGRRLAKLSKKAHPNIVRVRDLFQEGEVHCLVMDFVPGENLFQVVKGRGRLTEAEAISCFQQIGDALATMHEMGLVHRDAHPGNIILRDDGRAILIDFGIAKELVPATVSSTGDAGNKGFAPYEQLARGSREPNVDVYCLAATLYYAVTGQRPTPSLERKLHDVPLIPPERFVPSISQGLNKAILKGMELEAKGRAQSMRRWLTVLAVSKQPRQTKIIPWDWLTEILLFYVIQGWVFAVAETEAVAWAAAVTGAVAGAGPGAVAEIFAVSVVVAGARAGPVAGTMAGTVALAVAGTVALALAKAWSLAWALAGAMTWAGAAALSEAWFWAWAIAGAIAGAAAWAGVMDVPRSGTVIWAAVMAAVMAWAGAIAGNKLLKSFNRFHTFLILASTSTLGLGLGWLIYKILRWP